MLKQALWPPPGQLQPPRGNGCARYNWARPRPECSSESLCLKSYFESKCRGGALSRARPQFPYPKNGLSAITCSLTSLSLGDEYRPRLLLPEATAPKACVCPPGWPLRHDGREAQYRSRARCTALKLGLEKVAAEVKAFTSRALRPAAALWLKLVKFPGQYLERPCLGV